MPKKGTFNPTADHQIVDGIAFYRENTGVGYYLGNVPDENGKKHAVRCHVYVWEKANGKVPDGYAVHHIDHNPANNDLSNLQLIKRGAHQSYHASLHKDKARENMDKSARPAAIKWHGSKLGREWHKEHYEEYTREQWMQPVTLTCQVCGKEYVTTHAKATTSRFCSNNCKSKFRRMSGVDNETRHCIICGAEYVCNKYSKQQTCGKRECANESQRRKKIGRPRPQRKAD